MVNVNVKILVKMLATQIQQHIKRIIHRDQVESFSRMQGWFTICKPISVIPHITINRKKKNHVKKQKKHLTKLSICC